MAVVLPVVAVVAVVVVVGDKQIKKGKANRS